MSEMAIPGRGSSNVDASPVAGQSHSASSLVAGHKSRATAIAVLIGIIVCLAYTGYSLHTM